MPRKAVRVIIIGISLISSTMRGQTRVLMDDPLFAIRYDTQKVHFETIPRSVVKSCAELRDRYVKGWLYAHARTADTEYFVISGLMKGYDEVRGRETAEVHPDTTGLIVALRGSTCSVEAQDSFYWRKDSPVWNLPETALHELAMDALHRYAKALGGKRKFLNKITHREELAPALREQLDIFKQHL